MVRWLDTMVEISHQSSYLYQNRITVVEEERQQSRSNFPDFDRFQTVADRSTIAIFRFQDLLERVDKEHTQDPDFFQLKTKLVEFGRVHLEALVKLNKLKQEFMKETLEKVIITRD